MSNDEQEPRRRDVLRGLASMAFLTAGIDRLQAQPRRQDEVTLCGAIPIGGGPATKDSECPAPNGFGDYSSDLDCGKPKQGGGRHTDNDCGKPKLLSEAHEDSDCSQSLSDSDCGKSRSVYGSVGYEDNDCSAAANADNDCGKKESFDGAAYTDSDCDPLSGQGSDQDCGKASPTGSGVNEDNDCGGCTDISTFTDQDCSRGTQGDQDCPTTGRDSSNMCSSQPDDFDDPLPPSNPDPPS